MVKTNKYFGNNTIQTTNGHIVKKCHICGEYKPANRKYFHLTRVYNGTKTDLHSYCKQCRKEIKK